MKADTTKVGTRILVSHGAERKADGSRCWGGVAEVKQAHEHTFLAACECGWKFGAMHTAGYNAAE